MKEILSFCFACLIWIPVHGQLGITASSTINQSIDWQVVTENYLVHRRADFLKYGTSAVVDYVLPLKIDRIRIRPAVEFMMANSVYQKHYFQVSTIGLAGNLEIALLSAKDKSGNKRPIRPFLQLSPGIAQAFFRYERPKDDINNLVVTSKSRRLTPCLGANIFFEIKLSPLLTLAPMTGLRFHPNLYWKDLTEHVTKATISKTYDKVNWLQYHFGLRVGLNLK